MFLLASQIIDKERIGTESTESGYARFCIGIEDITAALSSETRIHAQARDAILPGVRGEAAV